MTIHREGIKTLTAIAILFFVINLGIFLISGRGWLFGTILGLSVVGICFVAWFFRNPKRARPDENNSIISPADGTILHVDEIYVDEFFNDVRTRVSIFMSAKNVHINWLPVSGYVRYQRYNPGRHFLAKHPKSSELNERCSVVIEDPEGRQVMVRQIAGIMARRVVTYPKAGEDVRLGDQLGFIKFGSRVDVFLPRGTPVEVVPGQKTRGRITVIASWSFR